MGATDGAVQGTNPAAAEQPAVIVKRISDDRGEDRAGNQTQAAGCSDEVAALGLDVVGVWQDDIGGDQLDRPRLGAVPEDIRAGVADELLTYSVDRLARDMEAQIYVIRAVKRVGGRYVSANEDVEGTPTGRFSVLSS